MKKTAVTLVLLALLCTVSALFAKNAGNSSQVRFPPYHRHPSPDPLPETLDPALFADDHGAFVAYALAQQVRGVLYQEPCFCYCNKSQGHESLLDCYTNRHGRFCNVCRMEAIFTFFETKKGRSPSQIRRALAKGRAWTMDLGKITDELFSGLQEAEKNRSRAPSSAPAPGKCL